MHMPDVHPKIHPPTATLSHTISTQIRIRSAFFLRRTQKVSGSIFRKALVCTLNCQGFKTFQMQTLEFGVTIIRICDIIREFEHFISISCFGMNNNTNLRPLLEDAQC